MLNQQTISVLHSLKLHGMAESFEKRLADSNQASLSHDEFVGLLVQDEKLYRDNLGFGGCSRRPGSARKPPWRISTTERPADSTGR